MLPRILAETRAQQTVTELKRRHAERAAAMRAALEAVAGPYVRCVYLSNPVLSREEFYEFLAPKFGLSERGLSR